MIGIHKVSNFKDLQGSLSVIVARSVVWWIFMTLALDLMSYFPICALVDVGTCIGHACPKAMILMMFWSE